jgi:outer membrane protein assembly factor BamB
VSGFRLPAPRSLALLLVAAAWLALGPLVLLVVVALAVPRVRRWFRPSRRVVLGWMLAAVAVVGVVVVLPDGRLPIPPGAGLLVAPSYVGHPATPQPITMDLPQHPRLARNGASSMHDDAWASDAYAGPGPLGRSVEVDTAWYGVEECATLAFDRAGRIVALCGTWSGPRLHVLDPDTMRPLVTRTLPKRSSRSGVKPWQDLCAGAYFYLDDQDRAVVATTDRRILVVATSRADGSPALSVRSQYDLSGDVPSPDCLIALMPDWDGRIWFVTRQGRTGFVDPTTRTAHVLDLGEQVANSFAVDQEGGVYVVTVSALYRLGVAGGVPSVTWRIAYDRGRRTKSGQLSRGSGTTPTVLPGGLVAITDNAEPRMHVQFYDIDDGQLVCQAAVFGPGESATENSLVSVGDGVVVENNHGYSSPLSTLLGRATTGGLARVDVAGGHCTVVWTSAVVAPTSVPKVSLATGLVYAYTKRRSAWGVSAWYFTAIDARTGTPVWSVRTGLGVQFNNHYAAITLAPDASAYVATLAGMVRVRDQPRRVG